MRSIIVDEIDALAIKPIVASVRKEHDYESIDDRVLKIVILQSCAHEVAVQEPIEVAPKLEPVLMEPLRVDPKGIDSLGSEGKDISPTGLPALELAVEVFGLSSQCARSDCELFRFAATNNNLDCFASKTAAR